MSSLVPKPVSHFSFQSISSVGFSKDASFNKVKLETMRKVLIIAFIVQNPALRKMERDKCMSNSRKKPFEGEDVCAQLLQRVNRCGNLGSLWLSCSEAAVTTLLQSNISPSIVLWAKDERNNF